VIFHPEPADAAGLKVAGLSNTRFVGFLLEDLHVVGVGEIGMSSAKRAAVFFAMVTAFAIGAPVGAQVGPIDPGAEQLVDRIVAVVGDSVILLTEVQQGLALVEAQGWQMPTDPEGIMQARRQILDQLINEQLLIQDAAQDTTIVIDPQELQSTVDQEIEGQIQRYGTQRRFQQAVVQQGFTVASYREDRREYFRRQMIRERYLAKRALDPTAVVVSEDEIQAYYDDNIDRMPQRPPTIEFINYRLTPQPSDTARASAEAKAREVLAEARKTDADFEALAQRYSMGPSREVGGELGWIRENGQYDADFEAAVFTLPPGFVSEPVVTQFGIHLILVERVRGGERRVRHILFIPTITDDDIDDNLSRAEEAKRMVDAGEPLDSLPGLTADTLVVPTNRLAEISNFYARAMANAKVGDVFGPLPLDNPQQANVMGVVKVLEIREGGIASLSDMRDRIEPTVQEAKLVESVVEGLRARTYIDIRLDGGSPPDR
jgi:parvulin-like peptidyl-prolyl isomerase